MDTAVLSQYLTFQVDKEHFALSVSNVREVLEFSEVTKVPRMPNFMKGVINLRGSVVPVIDLRVKFGIPEGKTTVNTSIVVTELYKNDEMLVMGLLTDSVEAVIEIPEPEILPAPKIGTRVDNSFIQGMGKVDEDFIIILNIDKLLSGEEVVQIAEQQDLKDEEKEA